MATRTRIASGADERIVRPRRPMTEGVHQPDLWSSPVIEVPLEPREQIFAWGQARGFPEFRFPLAEGHEPWNTAIVPAGEQTWREFAAGADPFVMRKALEAMQAQDLELE